MLSSNKLDNNLISKTILIVKEIVKVN